MNTTENTMKFRQFHAQIGGPAPGPLGRLANFLLGAVLLVFGFIFSLVAFVAVSIIGAIGGAWLWWKTRDFRRELNAQMAEQAKRANNQPRPNGGYIIEGEAVREPANDESATTPPGNNLPR